MQQRPKRSHGLLVGAAVAVVCAAILALFTDIEVKLIHWVDCSPMGGGRDQASAPCR